MMKACPELPPSPIYLSLVVEGFVCINNWGRGAGDGPHPASNTYVYVFDEGKEVGPHPGSITYVYVIDEGSFLFSSAFPCFQHIY